LKKKGAKRLNILRFAEIVNSQQSFATASATTTKNKQRKLDKKTEKRKELLLIKRVQL
jgi:hypothetical protein